MNKISIITALAVVLLSGYIADNPVTDTLNSITKALNSATTSTASFRDLSEEPTIRFINVSSICGGTCGGVAFTFPWCR